MKTEDLKNLNKPKRRTKRHQPTTAETKKTTKKKTTTKTRKPKAPRKKKDNTLRQTEKWKFNYEKNIDSKPSAGSEENYRKLIDKITEGESVDNMNLTKSFDDYITRSGKDVTRFK